MGWGLFVEVRGVAKEEIVEAVAQAGGALLQGGMMVEKVVAL